MIPKLIHQTAKTHDIPADCRPYVERLKALHPDWTYKLWTDEDNLELVRTRMPEFLDVYHKLPRNIMRADVIRYVIMYVMGGLYLDTDYEMLKPFDLTQHDVVIPMETDGSEPGSDGKIRLANSIFASVPGHPFWRMVLDDLISNPPVSADVNVLNTTGPLFLTRIYEQARAAGLNIHTPAPILFSPITPRLKRDYRAIVRSGASYGIHHCHGTWRQYSAKERLKTGVRRLIGKFL